MGRIYSKFAPKTNLSDPIFLNLSDIFKSFRQINHYNYTYSLKYRRLQIILNGLSMVPVAVDELVASLEDGVGFVDGVVLVVEAVLAGQDDVEVEILKWPNQRPNDWCDAQIGPIRLEKGLF